MSNLSVAYLEALKLRNEYLNQINFIKQKRLPGQQILEKEELTVQLLEQFVLDIDAKILSKEYKGEEYD